MLALMGGDEFRANCTALDRWLLATLGQASPQVVIVPTAAAPQNPARAAQNGIDYFQALGARARSVMLLDRQDAENTAIVEVLVEADLVYLVGGDPRYLLSTLRETTAWETIAAKDVPKAAVVGSSAGAMVLGEWMLDGRGGWQRGLGLAPRVAVIPHLEHQPDSRVESMRRLLGPGVTLLGIDSATACATTDASKWEVVGAGRATVLSQSGAATVLNGSGFRLPGN